MVSLDVAVLRMRVWGADKCQEAWDEAQAAASALAVVLPCGQGLEGKEEDSRDLFSTRHVAQTWQLGQEPC